MWDSIDTCYYTLVGLIDLSNEFIGFDFDDTLVGFKTGCILPNVIDTLKELSKMYNIVVFSNQYGITKGKQTHEQLQDKFLQFAKEANVDMTIFYSTEKDKYRKPNIGMFNLFKSLISDDISIKYYCGDACGRQKDFSYSDLYFANNCGIKFKTPENVFNKSLLYDIAYKKYKNLEIFEKDEWLNGSLKSNYNLFETTTADKLSFDFDFSKKIMICLVGPPGSGKSTLSRHLSEIFNLSIINGDTIGNISKQTKYFKSLDFKKINGVIIDNTNNTNKVRNHWIDISKNFNKYIIEIDIPKRVSFYLSNYRTYMGEKYIPSVVIHTYYKRHECIVNSSEIEYIKLDMPIVKDLINHKVRLVL